MNKQQTVMNATTFLQHSNYTGFLRSASLPFLRFLRSASSLFCRVIAAFASLCIRGGIEGVSGRFRSGSEDWAKTGRSHPLTHPKGMAVISEKIPKTCLQQVRIPVVVDNKRNWYYVPTVCHSTVRERLHASTTHEPLGLPLSLLDNCDSKAICQKSGKFQSRYKWDRIDAYFWGWHTKIRYQIPQLLNKVNY